MTTDEERREVAWIPNGADPMPGVPEVRVLDEDGNEVLRGWYVRHKNRQPYCIGDELRPEDVDHCVIVDGFADWGMPRSLEAKKVTPPHHIEVVGGVDRDALLKVADMLECDGECSECECGKGTFCEAPTIAAARIREALGVER